MPGNTKTIGAHEEKCKYCNGTLEKEDEKEGYVCNTCKPVVEDFAGNKRQSERIYLEQLEEQLPRYTGSKDDERRDLDATAAQELRKKLGIAPRDMTASVQLAEDLLHSSFSYVLKTLSSDGDACMFTAGSSIDELALKKARFVMVVKKNKAGSVEISLGSLRSSPLHLATLLEHMTTERFNQMLPKLHEVEIIGYSSEYWRLFVDIAGVIAKMENLSNLYLIDCNMKDIPEPLFNLKRLRLLHLGENGEITAVPESIRGLTSLNTLSLDMTGIREFPASVCALDKLKEIHLCGTPISEIGEKTIERINGMRSLNYLNLLSVKLNQVPKFRDGIEMHNSAEELHASEGMDATGFIWRVILG